MAIWLQRGVIILVVEWIVIFLRAKHLALQIMGLLGVVAHRDSLVRHGALHGVLVVLELRVIAIVVDGADVLLLVHVLHLLLLVVQVGLVDIVLSVHF